MNNYFCELSKNIWEDALRVEYLKNKNLSVYTVVDGIVIPPQKGDAFQPDGPIFGWGGSLIALETILNCHCKKHKVCEIVLKERK